MEVNVLTASLKLPLNTDCVKWCPYNLEDEVFNGLLVCGCYQLNDGTRHGALEFYRFIPDGDPKIQKISALETPGVFRLSWIKREPSDPTVAAVFTDGSYREFSVASPESPKQSLKIPVTSSHLLTSFCSPENSVVVGSSDGTLHLLDLETQSVKNSWVGHSIFGAGSEIWTVEREPDNSEIIYSGADDGILKQWDLRTGFDVNKVVKGHDSGVTNILFDETDSHFFLTGSYDEILRQWDTRKLIEPVSQFSTGGGIWDMSWCPSKPGRIALACMYGGLKVLDPKDPFEVIMDPELPESTLLYGVSWRFPSAKKSMCLASCSFYDNVLSIWNLGK